MNEITIFRRLVHASTSQPSGIGDIRDAVWNRVDEAEAAFSAGNNAFGYINAFSMRVATMAAAAVAGCMVVGYVIIDNFLHEGAILSPYYAILDGMYSLWGTL